jgi:hypothetical protein
MRIVYTAKITSPIVFEDYWPVPFMGGTLTPIVTDGRVSGVEVSIPGQPLSYAPTWNQERKGRSVGTVTIEDKLQPFVEFQLRDALTFLQCLFDVEIDLEDMEARYFAESPEEEAALTIRSWKTSKDRSPLLLPYDLWTRALLAAEKSSPPHFEATLVHAARTEMLAKRYIDSFRYSFLMFEALYGNGKFKTDQLRDAFRDAPELVSAIEFVLKNGPMKPKRPGSSDTELLVSSSPTASAVIDHLVEKRGFYFHGNVRRRDAWQPHQQERAEALCLLALEVALKISADAAGPMFLAEHSQNHFKNAEKAGAVMTLRVSFDYQEPPHSIPKTASVNLRVPGTKVTRKLAVYAAQQFLQMFGDRTPNADLKKATCVTHDAAIPVFDLTFHASETSEAAPATEPTT